MSDRRTVVPLQVGFRPTCSFLGQGPHGREVAGGKSRRGLQTL